MAFSLDLGFSIRDSICSTTVFGVSTESMQLSYDHRGNSVPTILLLMQQRLYAQEGLQAEGIFRINADNGQEEFVRSQLNAGVVPIGIDVHCLAGLIKGVHAINLGDSGFMVTRDGCTIFRSTTQQHDFNSYDIDE